MVKVWWLQIEPAQRGYQDPQWLPKGETLRPLARVASPWCGTTTPADWRLGQRPQRHAV